MIVPVESSTFCDCQGGNRQGQRHHKRTKYNKNSFHESSSIVASLGEKCFSATEAR
jgi:hypothetical protein